MEFPILFTIFFWNYLFFLLMAANYYGGVEVLQYCLLTLTSVPKYKYLFVYGYP